MRSVAGELSSRAPAGGSVGCVGCLANGLGFNFNYSVADAISSQLSFGICSEQKFSGNGKLAFSQCYLRTRWHVLIATSGADPCVEGEGRKRVLRIKRTGVPSGRLLLPKP